MCKAVFLDRDGVLNVDHGYVYKTDTFAWMPGAQQAVKYLNDAGFLVIVVSNQSGVARGYYQEQDIRRLHAWMNEQLAQFDAHIDAFYYCPHHPEGKLEAYRQICECRKPKPGLILQAMRDWDVDLAKSLMIGDKPSDVEAAGRAGMAGYLFQDENLYAFVKPIMDGWAHKQC